MQTLKTHNEPCTVEISLRGEGEVRLVGVDSEVPTTVYLNRDKVVNGSVVLCVPMPITPPILAIECLSDDRVSMKARLLPLPSPALKLPAETWAFLDFIAQIAKYASTLPEANLMDEEEEFFAHYADRLFSHDTGEERFSPARVSKKTGDMELNRLQFLDFTVPMRFFIMLHERAHYELYSNNEKECDAWALHIYLRLGFSPIEAVYAMTKVFNDNNRNVTRVKKAIHIILKKIKNA